MSKKLPRKERRFRAIRRLEDVKITVEDPCTVSWDSMEGSVSSGLAQTANRSVKRCHFCQLNVYDFAGLSPDEIVALLNQHEGKLCAQFYARADGTMTVEQCDRANSAHHLARGGLVISRQAEYLSEPDDSDS